MYECNECKNQLEHLNCEFWICKNCNKIIEIPITKNWDIEKENDNRFYEHIFEDRNNPIIRHEIGIKKESRDNYFNFICGD